jgi:hypothetical protein
VQIEREVVLHGMKYVSVNKLVCASTIFHYHASHLIPALFRSSIALLFSTNFRAILHIEDYGEMQKLKLKGKKVAVFGLGDSVSYGENYADASGELHDTFQNLGCNMMGYTSQEGYEHTASKAIRGDNFCGLLCDNVNQEELTSGRVKKWVKQLIEEGILNDGIEASSHSSDSFSTATDPAGESVEKSAENSVATVESTSNDLSTKGDLIDGYVPYRNLITGVTMWVSSDGRTCFYR